MMMSRMSSRRSFVKTTGLVFLGAHAGPLSSLAFADDRTSIVDTSSGKVRGNVIQGINVFKGIPYGGSTAGRNRFMPPTKPAAWTGARDVLAWGPTAPQTVGSTSTRPDDPAEN